MYSQDEKRSVSFDFGRLTVVKWSAKALKALCQSCPLISIKTFMNINVNTVHNVYLSGHNERIALS